MMKKKMSFAEKIDQLQKQKTTEKVDQLQKQKTTEKVDQLQKQKTTEKVDQLQKQKTTEKVDQLQKQKKINSDSQSVKGVIKNNRFLITVNVLGSAGPLRFVANENDLVAAVIDTSLKSYAREGRLPVLGSDVNDFVLYCADARFDALNPRESIGCHGGRNFVLCKKQRQPQMTEGRSVMIAQKRSGSWKAWLNKPFSKIILSR